MDRAFLTLPTYMYIILLIKDVGETIILQRIDFIFIYITIIKKINLDQAVKTQVRIVIIKMTQDPSWSWAHDTAYDQLTTLVTVYFDYRNTYQQVYKILLNF